MRSLGIATALVVASVSLAPAAILDAPYGEKSSVAPARYNHKFSGRLVVKKVSPRNVGTACDYLFDSQGVDGGASSGFDRGCSLLNGNTCYIVIHDSPYGKALPRETLAHEVAHCNGWGWDHPND